MHLKTALVALFASALSLAVVPSPAEAKDPTGVVWHWGTLMGLEVNADGTLRGGAMKLAENKGSQSFLACAGTRMDAHPELLYAMQHGWLTRVKVANGCASMFVVNR